MDDFREYEKLLGEIPSFLIKYLELPILTRLKDISLLCGMDYASSYAYDFSFYVSRFDHSLHVALWTWNLTGDKKATLAALFHDISTPVFSHVIDYMNGDFVNQESTEEKTAEVLLASKELQICLEEDEIFMQDISDFKEYSIVDLPRPAMCADRLDNIITVGMTWVKQVDLSFIRSIFSSLEVVKNEQGQEEIGFTSIEVAKQLQKINDAINQLTHTNHDTYMMLLTARIVKRCIDLQLVAYDELFLYTEHDMLQIIEDATPLDKELLELWTLFKTIKDFPLIEQPKIKDKNLDPLVKGKRLSLFKNASY